MSNTETAIPANKIVLQQLAIALGSDWASLVAYPSGKSIYAISTYASTNISLSWEMYGESVMAYGERELVGNEAEMFTLSLEEIFNF